MSLCLIEPTLRIRLLDDRMAEMHQDRTLVDR